MAASNVPELHWDPIPLPEIEAARERLRGVVLRTPLVRLDADDGAGREIFLKLENLQPVRSFKLSVSYQLIRATSLFLRMLNPKPKSLPLPVGLGNGLKK